MMSEAAQQQLARWGMTDATAQAAQLFDVPDVSRYYPAMKPGPAIMIPYFGSDGQPVKLRNGDPFCRVRRLTPDEVEVKGFVKKKKIRYTQPAGMPPQVYFPQNGEFDWYSIQQDPSVPLMITEGEAKAITAAADGFQCVALGGVFNFALPSGQLIDGLEQFVWEGRKVYLVFDSDAATNPNVLAAEARLVAELQLRRNAHCHIVRLPSPNPETKVGLDDYLQMLGPDSLEKLLNEARQMSTLDAKVVGMNKRYAWIDKEGAIFDFTNRSLVQKGAFLSGNLSSTETHLVPGQKGVKVISVAETWLKHPHAQRYSEQLFRPMDGIVVPGKHSPALNLWNGWGELEHGDVTPFLELNDFLFSKQPFELREVALKTVIYKAQNPHVKIPLAIVIIGPQGSGKTVWADSIRDAFEPYTATPNPASLSGDFEGWLETTLMATIHEMTPADVKHSGEKIKALVSDLVRPMNEKYRPQREVNYYGFQIITSNYTGVGAYASDDRRMIVYNTPKPAAQALYDAVWAWREAGGGRHLLTWMLNYDLKGWLPPRRAPMTAAKAMATMEAMSPVQRLANDMQNADQHVIIQWLDMAAAWAQGAELSGNPTMAGRARDIAQHIKQFQVRPFYTPDELAMMFPAIIENLMGSKLNSSTPSGAISRELRDAGIPFLVNKDSQTGFRHQGQLKQYLIVAEFSKWEDGVTQKEFEQLMKEWPTYGQLKGKRR